MSLFFIFKLLFFLGILFAAILFFLSLLKAIKWKQGVFLLSAYGLISFFLLLIQLLSRREIPNDNEEKIVKKNVPNIRQEECPCTWSTLKLKKNDYALEHRPLAQKISNDRYILNEKMENKLLQKGYLVNVPENDGYGIKHLRQSKTILIPIAKKRLDELGRRFRAKISLESERMSYFVISSMTRTDDQQKAVRNSNPHAATPGKSAHSYGVAFDIAYIRCGSINCNYGIQALVEVLREMQKEGKILLCAESKCIHVTVCR